MQITNENWLNNLAQIPVTTQSSLKEVLQLQTPAISSLVAQSANKQDGILVFKVIIINLLDFIGVEWSGMQIDEAAEACYDECYWMTFGEIKLFAAKARISSFGRSNENPYGKIYGKFTPMLLMQWLEEYKGDVLFERASYIGLQKKEVIVSEPDTEEEKQMSERFGKLVGIMKAWDDELKEEEQKKQQEIVRKRQESHKTIKQINMEEVVKQFSKK